MDMRKTSARLVDFLWGRVEVRQRATIPLLGTRPSVFISKAIEIQGHSSETLRGEIKVLTDINFSEMGHLLPNTTSASEPF